MPDVTYSMLKTYRRCRREFRYKYIDQIGSKAPRPPLLKGTILHEMLDARATGRKDPGDILEEYRKKYKKLLNAEQEFYGDLIGDLERIFRGYCRHWMDEDLTYEESETAAITDLTPDLRYCGTIDKIVLDKRGRRWIMDHKCHKTIPSDQNRLSDLQLVLYIWAWNRWNPDRPVEGIIWDYLRTKPPTIPEQLKNGQLTQRKNIDTDVVTYRKELKRLKLDPKPYRETLERLEKTGADRFYRRIYLPSPSKELTASILEDARTEGILMHRLKVYPRNLTYQCEGCEFFSLCQAELRGLDAKYVLKHEYEHKEPRDYGAEEED